MQVLFAELANLIAKVNFMAALKEASRNPTMFTNIGSSPHEKCVIRCPVVGLVYGWLGECGYTENLHPPVRRDPVIIAVRT